MFRITISEEDMSFDLCQKHRDELVDFLMAKNESVMDVVTKTIRRKKKHSAKAG
jgi:hypothetical protein